jgi:hypothetical protein
MNDRKDAEALLAETETGGARAVSDRSGNWQIVNH